MPIDNSKAALIIFCCHFSGRIGTEGSYLIIKSRRMIDQLGFIQIIIQILHDLISDLNTHTNIYGARRGLDPNLFAFILKPVSTFPSYCGYHFTAVVNISLIGSDANCLSILYQDLFHHSIKDQLCSLIHQMLLKLCIDLVAFLCSKVPDRALDKL